MLAKRVFFGPTRAPMEAAAQLTGICKSFPGIRALWEVDLTLLPGRIHALVGENGAGKSTLINILSGVLQPDRGTLRFDGRTMTLSDARTAHRHAIVTVHQELDLFPDLSLMENIGLEQGFPYHRWGWIDWREQRRRTHKALAAVEMNVPPSLLGRRLLPAQRQLIEIAAAVTQQPRVLILDEPTSSLSRAESETLFRHLARLRHNGTAILYVSHRLEEVLALADELTVLRDGQRVWVGPTAEITSQELISCMVARDVKLPTEFVANRSPSAASQRKTRFACRGMTAPDGSFTDVTLEVASGEVLGVYGLIGAGRTEWAQALFGLGPLQSGELTLDGLSVRPVSPAQMTRHGLVLVPEDRLRNGLCRGLTIRENAVLPRLRQIARGVWITKNNEDDQAANAIAPFGIRMRSLNQSVGTLSGGNQQKIILARWLACEPKVLVLDEPTRGVDVGAKAEIYRLIRELAATGRAVVLISSELSEVMAQCDRVAVFRMGKLAAVSSVRAVTTEQVAADALPPTNVITKLAGSEKHAGRHQRILNSAARVLLRSVRETALFSAVVIVFVVVHWQTGRFFQPGNIRAIVADTAMLSCCALAAALVILAGGLDISLGALMALSAGIAGRLWEQGWPILVVAGAAVLVGGMGGALNAGLAIVGRVHPIVITLGTMSLFRGLGLSVWWRERDVQILGSQREWMFSLWAGLPFSAWIGILLAFAISILLASTVSGREFFALGSNAAAAHRVGIERSRVWLKAFTLSGMLAGLAGFLYLAKTGSLQPTSFEDKTLEAIAAAVVGGVAITGGRGSVHGVVLGCLFLMALVPACTLLHISEFWQRAVIGSVMVVAVTLDALGRSGEME